VVAISVAAIGDQSCVNAVEVDTKPRFQTLFGKGSAAASAGHEGWEIQCHLPSYPTPLKSGQSAH
jgi:hypothetical protein